MSNQYFQFRQFTIVQDKCAMKVSTDACIQGAYTPIADGIKRALDIGTGTGLLSLMLAQRNERITIDAVELDALAAGQAKENAATSSFGNRVHILEGDIVTFAPSFEYDLIICNPPFFTNSLLGDTAQRNMARHTLTLTYRQLLEAIIRLLADDGTASVLLPFSQQQQWEQLVRANDLYLHRRLFVKPYQHHSHNRVISILSKHTASCIDEELVIYRAQNSYTPEAIALLSPFYVKEMN